jgi:predicted ATPase
MLKRIAISGFRSVEHATLELGRLNVLIGANGAGKSNLISFFELLRNIGRESLQHFIARQGGANALLFWSAKRTQRIQAEVEYEFGGAPFRYAVDLGYAAGDTLIFEEERYSFQETGPWQKAGTGHKETQLTRLADSGGEGFRQILFLLDACGSYHFHDTSQTAAIRQHSGIQEFVRLREHGGNLAAVLYNLRTMHSGGEMRYRRIVQTIRQVAPWFQDFVLERTGPKRGNVSLYWRGQDPDVEFMPHQLPDGALRAMALITLLSLPDDMLPPVLVIDEPELGLHPHALAIVAALAHEAGHRHQIILATQSVSLLDEFDASDLVVVEHDQRATTFERLEPKQLEEWLEEYSIGELWQKNVIGGGPV